MERLSLPPKEFPVATMAIMRCSRHPSLTAVVLGSCFALACPGTLASRQCTLLGCRSEAWMAPLSLAMGYEDIRTSTITICRNDFCLGGGLDLGADAPKLG